MAIIIKHVHAMMGGTSELTTQNSYEQWVLVKDQ